MAVKALHQGPSILSRNGDLLHITSHDGYTIEYPRDFEHRHRGSSKILLSALKVLVKILGMGGHTMTNVPSIPTGYVTSALSSLSTTIDNRAQLDAVGIDTNNMFLAQVVVDTNQQQEMELLLRRAVSNRKNVGDGQDITGGLKGIVLEGGQTIWICSRCLNCLRSRRSIEETSYVTLSQYKVLTMSDPKMEATLCNDLSVKFLTRGLSRNTGTIKLTIHIIHTTFEEARADVTRRKAIIELFNKLGQALSRQRELVHLEIHGHSANGNIYSGQVCTGLNAVFRCRSLRILRVSGVPDFLQDKDISIKCQKLEILSLQGLLVNTEQVSRNLWALAGVRLD
ncbi:hypothetical protein BGX31_003938 [Mortierella sp. GBA43]|nr:hypothetical protein BGX31_003938 [Mortierella sp. GBA43]